MGWSARRVPAGGGAMLLLSVAALAPLVDALAGGTFVGNPVDTLAAAGAAALVGAWLRWPVAVLCCAVAAGLMTVANQVADPGRYTASNDAFFFAVLIGGPALAGALVSVRAGQVRELRRLTQLRAEQRDAEVRTARLEERNRVEAAVTQSMMQRLSAVVVQASGARSNPVGEDVHAALRRIEESGRATLDDLRDTLGSLRTPGTDQLEAVDRPHRRTPAQRLGLLDVLVACCGVPVAVEAVTSGAARGPAVANVVAGLLVGAPLLLRRTTPLVAAVVCLAVATVMTAWWTPLTSLVSVLLPLSLMAYALGAHTRRTGRVAGAAVLLAGGAAVTLASPAADRDAGGAVPSLVWGAVAFAAGVLAAQHGDRAASLRDLLREIEAGRDIRLRLAVAEQRQALARDLHDTVAHAMTVVCLHAEAAQRQWGHVDAVETSLVAIEMATRDAMARLRQGLVSLETGDGPVPELLRFADALGVELDLRSDGLHRPLAPHHQQLVERVVREALVNAARHAPGQPVEVLVDADDERLVVAVSNRAGDAPAYALGSGTGLIGLGELLHELGGHLEHGRSDGRFRVQAILPVSPPVPA